MRISFTLASLLFLLGIFSVHATHVLGTEIELECLNNCTTRVYLTNYTECNSTSGSTVQFDYGQVMGPCFFPPNLTNSYGVASSVEVTPICPLNTAICGGAQGIRKIYEIIRFYDYDFCNSIGCNVIPYSQSSRVNSDAFPPSTGFYVPAPHLVFPICNNSPQFRKRPQFFACNGQITTMDWGANDPEGDSLVYSLEDCMEQTLSNLPQPIGYNAGFNGQTPLGPTWSASIDPATGLLQLTPVPGNPVSGNICVQVSEYRNGQLIGTQVRDHLITIWDCDTVQTNPILGGPYNLSGGATLLNPTTIVSCSNGAICFDIDALEPDSLAGQTVELSWDNGITGATFSDPANPSTQNTIVGASPTGRFCWANPTPGTYTFSLSAEDDGCTFQARTDQVITVVIGPAAQAFLSASSPTIDTCGTDTVTLNASALPGTYTWSTGGAAPTEDITQPGTYHVTVTSPAGCPSTDSITITPIAIPQVTGTVTTAPSTPLAFAPVYLVWHDPLAHSLSAIDTTMTDGTGNYAFCKFPEDTLYVKAAPQLPFFPGHLPTYSDTAVFWNSARPWLDIGAPQVVDFEVRAGINPGGPGFIGGLISQGANKTSGVGDPVPDVPVVLRDHLSGAYLGATVSDGNGYFEFPSLPLGAYEVAVDVPGVDEWNVPVVHTTASSPAVDSLLFRLHSTYLELYLPTSVGGGWEGAATQIIPNPSRETAYLQLELPEATEVAVAVWDVRGKYLHGVVAGEVAAGRHLYALPALSPGVYFIKIEINGQIQVRRLVRQ